MKTPRPFQEESIEEGRRQHLLVLDECGVGKTLQGVEIVARRSRADTALLPSLIVCTKNARWQWLSSLYEQAPDIERQVLGIHDPWYPDDYRNKEVAIVTHFEVIVRRHDSMSKVLWRTIVVDEAHRIRNRQADRTAAIKDLPAMRRIALTDTPMERTPADLWSILNWLYPNRYPGYHAFFERYAVTVPTHRNFFRVVPGCKEPEKLAAELAPFTFRRTRKEVAPWLPDTTVSTVPLEMNQKQAELYNAIDQATDVLVDIGEEDPLFVRNGLAKIVKLQQVTGNPRLVDPSKSRLVSVKEEWVTDYLNDNPDESIIIFCMFRDTVKWLSHKLGIPKILGGEARDPDISKLTRVVATIAAAGESLDMPHINTAIFVDCSWSHTKMTQAMDRIARYKDEDDPTAKAPKQAIYLTIPGTVDDIILESVFNKWNASQLVYELVRRKREGLTVPLDVEALEK